MSNVVMSIMKSECLTFFFGSSLTTFLIIRVSDTALLGGGSTFSSDLTIIGLLNTNGSNGPLGLLSGLLSGVLLTTGVLIIRGILVTLLLPAP